MMNGVVMRKIFMVCTDLGKDFEPGQRVDETLDRPASSAAVSWWL
jgi:hypothetical protein